MHICRDPIIVYTFTAPLLNAQRIQWMAHQILCAKDQFNAKDETKQSGVSSQLRTKEKQLVCISAKTSLQILDDAAQRRREFAEFDCFHNQRLHH